MSRAFKSAWFSKAAKKAGISDSDLFQAIEQVAHGQCDDLGGGVYKKRLHKNEHRAIILAKVNDFWLFEYLFAKKDRSNITDNELKQFRSLAKSYTVATKVQFEQLLSTGSLIEIFKED
jgi:hypothetical protein